ncbi:hypothetical protein [Actinocorallia longicatena]|uniref:Recombination endonuclease VII n=1 Tax=Actinocorallia longicatena TaxID=111803 RepID=A0ABP6QBL6_9ACTN
MIKALRTRKARTSTGTCALCRTPLVVGQRISQYQGMRAWVHSACAVKSCEHCHQRLPLTRIAQGFTAHPMCQGEAE